MSTAGIYCPNPLPPQKRKINICMDKDGVTNASLLLDEEEISDAGKLRGLDKRDIHFGR